MSGIADAANHVAAAILTGAVAVVVAGVVAYIVATKYGGKSRRNRQMVFTIVGAMGLITAMLVVSWRLHA